MENINITIVERAKELCHDKGFSYEYMYKELDLPVSYFRDVTKRTNPMPTTRLERIAEFLDTTPEYLKGETDIKKRPTQEDEPVDDRIKVLNTIFSALSEEKKNALLESALGLLAK